MNPTLRSCAHGLVALVTAPPGDDELTAALAALAPQEQAIAATLGDVRRLEWIAGRTALHHALREQGLPHDVAILRDDRGAPLVPAEAMASVSHKGNRAAALAAPRRPDCSVGVDLERAEPPRVDLTNRVLTPRERAALTSLDPRQHGLAVSLRFSVKEAVYKAIDPWVRRYVGFGEVEVDLDADGGGRARPVAPELIDQLAGAQLELTWTQLDGHWLCTALARKR